MNLSHVNILNVLLWLILVCILEWLLEDDRSKGIPHYSTIDALPYFCCRVYVMIRNCTSFLWHMMTVEALLVEQLETRIMLCLATPLYFGRQKLHFWRLHFLLKKNIYMIVACMFSHLQ